MVWAVNQLARRNRVLLERVAQSAARLRGLQLGQAPGHTVALQTPSKTSEWK